MKRTQVTCDCCGNEGEQNETRELEVEVSFLLHPSSPGKRRTFDFCEDCIAKVAGHGVADNRCSKSLIHQSHQAVLGMFKAEAKKFDTAAEQEGGGG